MLLSSTTCSTHVVTETNPDISFSCDTAPDTPVTSDTAPDTTAMASNDNQPMDVPDAGWLDFGNLGNKFRRSVR